MNDGRYKIGLFFEYWKWREQSFTGHKGWVGILDPPLCYTILTKIYISSLKHTWNFINKVFSKTEKRSRCEVKSIISDNRFYTDSFEICKLFNEFFSPLSIRIHESIPPPLSDDGCSYYLRNVYVNAKFEFSSIQIIEIESTVLSLKGNKSDISTYLIKILKLIGNLVSPLLTIILNKSLTTV